MHRKEYFVRRVASAAGEIATPDGRPGAGLQSPPRTPLRLAKRTKGMRLKMNSAIYKPNTDDKNMRMNG